MKKRDINIGIDVLRLPEFPGKVILKEIHWVMILDALRKLASMSTRLKGS